MKIRSGFVSNSSSSSFILIGEHFEGKNTEAKLILEKFAPATYKKIVDKCASNPEDLEDELCDALYNLDSKRDGVDVIQCGYSGDMWVGKLLGEASSDGGEDMDIDIEGDKLLEIFADLRTKGLKPSLIGGTRGT